MALCREKGGNERMREKVADGNERVAAYPQTP